MLKPINHIKNFYDESTRRELNNWTLINYKNKNIFTDSNHNPPGTSYTTRWTESQIEFPKAAYSLQQKIIDHLNFKDYKLRYGQGIINTVNYPGCIVWEHKDGGGIIADYITYHCNIVSKKPKDGGITDIEGKLYNIDHGDLLCYAVSELNHSVTMVKDSIRMMWVFAFHVHESEIEL